jgi:hypothetical protein
MRLSYTGLVVELEHLKIETRLIDEKFANTMGEYVTVVVFYKSKVRAKKSI